MGAGLLRQTSEIHYKILQGELETLKLKLEGAGEVLAVTLDGRGAGIMADRTKDNVGRRMAVVFIENKSETRRGEGGEAVRVKRTTEEVINLAVIRERLGKRFQISGMDSPDEARNLALLLRAGALAAPMEIVEERTVGPSLGQENIEQGFKASAKSTLLTRHDPLLLCFLVLLVRQGQTDRACQDGG